jgi:hypothetical protein
MSENRCCFLNCLDILVLIRVIYVICGFFSVVKHMIFVKSQYLRMGVFLFVEIYAQIFVCESPR